jgi:3-hydroxyisobutyrate dehydrogenase-like beta-hydroxyacid dehydrogenase
MKIGVVGLGRMGSIMAARLVDAGHEVSVYDPVEAAVKALAAKGARGAASLAELAEGREAVLTVLPTDAIFEAVVTADGGLARHMPKGSVHMVCGTHGLPLVDRMAEAHEAAGQVLLATNMLGRPERVAEGALGFILGGPTEVMDRVQPVLDVLGSSFIRAGDKPAAAVVCKLANSFVLGCSIEATGEAMALVRKYGVDPHVLYSVLTDGLFDCVAYRGYGDVIAKQDWGRVGATVRIGLKDTDLAFEAAKQVNTPLPSGEVYRNHLLGALNHDEGDLDWSVMAREQFRHSGLE